MDRNNCHRLSWEGTSPSREQALIALEWAGRLDAHLAREILDGIPRDWPDRQAHMARLSILFPTTVFSLDILGPREGEALREYYRNGLVQQEHPITTFPGFDPERLGEPQGRGPEQTHE